ncbi:MAG TPA: trypsin-like peptidase domain-containing protein [Stellaceae bacterium]|nr:trypsin-like peptidase domain-containing protein [Stellaceae bacterium]
MKWYWRLILSFLLLMAFQLFLDSFSEFSSDDDEDQPPLPMPTDRVRRPLPLPSADDPLSTVEDPPLGAGEFSYGTSFPIAPGLWLTARHVANDSCSHVYLLVDGRRVGASLAYVHPQSDLTVLKTEAVNGPALALEDAPLEETDTGYTFGFPGGKLGATEDELLGRARMSVTGVTNGTGPSLTWVETQRFPESLKSLGGMSGGPMLDQNGKIVGVMVAASRRRGRIDTVAPEVLLATAKSYAGDVTSAAAASEIAGQTVALDTAVEAFSRNNQIAKTYCLPLGISAEQVQGLPR